MGLINLTEVFTLAATGGLSGYRSSVNG